MSYVFVVDTNRKPLNPIHPGEARYLLNGGKAAVLKRFPFTIILKHFECLKALGLPLECSSGGLTKFNRVTRGIEKAHWLDAACVGKSTPVVLDTRGVIPLLIKATGRQSRQMCRMDRYGFPRTRPKQASVVKGFRTGDIVCAVVTSGVKMGTYVGKVAVRATGSFTITTLEKTVQGISYRFCTIIHKCDGYSYQLV